MRYQIEINIHVPYGLGFRWRAAGKSLAYLEARALRWMQSATLAEHFARWPGKQERAMWALTACGRRVRADRRSAAEGTESIDFNVTVYRIPAMR